MKLFDVFPVFDINIVKGEGCYVWDDEGNKYLDLYGGHAVISIGHSHSAYVKAISEQLGKLGFYSNSIVNKIQTEFALKLGEICGYPDYDLFLINSGAEANENAFKLASFHNGRKKVLAFSKAFHGRTSATVMATDSPTYQAPVNLSDNFKFVELNNIESVKKELETKKYTAVIIEGMQGVAGIKMPSDKFLKGLREICTQTGTILILDEIQSGYGRSGKFFAHQYADIKADIITVAKGIANGFPMAGVIISPLFKAVHGQLGTTFGGSHLACAAALSVLETIEKENLIENAKMIGNYLIEELNKLPQVKEVRGRGLMIGIEFEEEIKEKRTKLLFEHKIFTGVSGTKVIRLLPPLSITKEQADHFLRAFTELLAGE